MRVSEFVVEVDPDAVARRRAFLLRVKRRSAWSGTAGGGLVVGICVAFILVFGFTAAWPLGISAVAGVLLIVNARREFAEARRMRATWEAIGIPPDVLRLSPDGLRCRLDTVPEPCFLPWSGVARVHRHAWLLTVVLAPGVTAATPGVRGLDQPQVRRALRRRRLRLFVSSPHQSPEEIDRAIAAFTAGWPAIR